MFFADELDKTEVDSDLLDVDGQPIKATRYKYAWTPPDAHLNGIKVIIIPNHTGI